ncbi:hypothetical protein ANN_05274 [Periplaneta americana]|uniref:Per a allergen n=1 Tax=Periplaneta americana TaxID=6978 RepID=A0ABQ8TCP1_PERAM|nr:hypothetical protein ANN_05274 [Periplaneta americana]
MAGLCEGGNEPPGSLKARAHSAEWSQATKGNIEGGKFDPVLWIEFGVAQWSERMVRRTKAPSSIPGAGANFSPKILSLGNEQAKIWGFPDQYSGPEMSTSGVHAHCGENVLVRHHA